MGTYATTTSFSTWLIGTALDTATTSLVGQCITWSENEINKKLAKRYDIASFQTSVPPHVRGMCEQLTTGLFYKHNARGGKDAITRGDAFVKSVMENLNELAMGKMELVDAAGAIISPRGTAKGVLSSTVDYTSTFGEDDPLNWKVDPDKLDAILSDRD